MVAALAGLAFIHTASQSAWLSFVPVDIPVVLPPDFISGTALSICCVGGCSPVPGPFISGVAASILLVGALPLSAVCAAAPPAIAKHIAVAKTKLFIVSSWVAF